MFAKLLIANRGEIACRVIRTARRMGIRTVAVYSDADADALHVREADGAFRIGPAPARDSYLKIASILDAARRSGADAIHPCYGFLAENADFAEACSDAGLVFVGPPPEAIRAMGSKAEAKRLMEVAGVPVVPGYHGADQGLEQLHAEAARIGYPILIKASAGGGGKGMRIVQAGEDFAAALVSARREAQSAFRDDRVILEKYLDRPRHVEVQVFADRFDTVVHLFERDCSIQRRHQKIIEEAPAPNLSAERRRAMHGAAVAATRAVRYRGAGTVEFIAEDERFYFMEMNTRLQVEHPVTEMIAGLDLVEWQLRVAAGECLPLRQDQIASRGHAIETRLYAEDPSRDFLPSTGTLHGLRFPLAASDLRIETAVRDGDAVTIHYDPMIAKLVAWGEDRDTARRRLIAALVETRVAGLVTNRDFLLRVLRHPAFASGAFDTGFIARHRDALLPTPGPAPFVVLAAASVSLLLDQQQAARSAGGRSHDPHSPWHERDGWRLDGAASQALRWRDAEKERPVRATPRRGGYAVGVEGESHAVHAEATLGDLVLDIDGARMPFTVVRRDNAFTVIDDNATWRLTFVDPLAVAPEASVAGGRLTAPMPGKIIQVLASAGETVKRGQPLLVLEAMKMEHSIAAPADGVVEHVNYEAGDLVEEGAQLVVFKAGGTAT